MSMKKMLKMKKHMIKNNQPKFLLLKLKFKSRRMLKQDVLAVVVTKKVARHATNKLNKRLKDKHIQR